jgi:acetyl-CoA carboxylase biotin carboxyl carrier protein
MVMSLDRNEILEIMRAFDESGFDELLLEVEGLKMVLGKGASRSGGTPNSITAKMQSEAAGLQVREEKIVPAVPLAESPREASARMMSDPIKPGLLSVKAPLMGIFYRSPKPGAPPFVSIGTYVTEDTNVCVIEVMKLFTGVRAGVRGRVVEICAENTRLVEYQQRLFLVDPSEESEDSSHS